MQDLPRPGKLKSNEGSVVQRLGTSSNSCQLASCNLSTRGASLQHSKNICS